MHRILILHFRPTEARTEVVQLLGESLTLEHLSCDKSLDKMAEYIAAYDGKVEAIALEGVARTLRLGNDRLPHQAAGRLFEIAQQTPVVDGSGVRDAMERWAVRLVAEAQPGIWSRKHILMTPGLNHTGLTRALQEYTETLKYADPMLYFSLPNAPFVGSVRSLDTIAGFTLATMAESSFRILFPAAGTPGTPRSAGAFEWADVLVGNMGSIRRYAPAELKRKVVVTESASDEDIADLKARGVALVVTTMPVLDGGAVAHHAAAAFEACLVALRQDPDAPLTENTYLNLMADLHWQPGIVRLSEEATVNRFAFVIHPLTLKFIHKAPQFRWTRYLPDSLVERSAAYLPPFYLSRITGIQSPATGQKVEGILLTLGGTPRELMRHDPAFVYRQLVKAAAIAERMGARLMGLGAFTSVVGDAGITVAQQADIAITSGNSLTVAATLETAKQAIVKMGHSLDDANSGRVMVIGATGSIGAVCSRLLAQAAPNITLVAPRPEKLIALKRTIEEETPGAQVTISTSADEYVADADLIVTTTTAFDTRIVDISKCKPGAVICDIARPPDISAEEAELRPDVLVIESGEILLPGQPNFGYDIGLPPGVSYACLAETALLALEGKFEDYTLGRNIEIERVKEIYRLYKKHGLQLSGIRSHGHFLTDADIAQKRRLADELRADPARFAQVQAQAAQALEKLPKGKSGVKEKSRRIDPRLVVAGAAAAAGGLLFWRKTQE